MLSESILISGQAIREPCYKLLAPIHADDTYMPEGEIIVTDMVPNEAMEPLNRAAEVKVQDWYARLPHSGNIRMEDYMAAALELRPKEGDKEISHDVWIAMVQRRAIEMRARAEGKRVEDLVPPRVVKPNAAVPPMANVAMNTGEAVQRPRSAKPGKVKHVAQPAPDRVKPEPVGTVRTSDNMQPTS